MQIGHREPADASSRRQWKVFRKNAKYFEKEDMDLTVPSRLVISREVEELSAEEGKPQDAEDSSVSGVFVLNYTCLYKQNG